MDRGLIMSIEPIYTSQLLLQTKAETTKMKYAWHTSSITPRKQQLISFYSLLPSGPSLRSYVFLLWNMLKRQTKSGLLSKKLTSFTIYLQLYFFQQSAENNSHWLDLNLRPLRCPKRHLSIQNQQINSINFRPFCRIFRKKPVSTNPF